MGWEGVACPRTAAIALFEVIEIIRRRRITGHADLQIGASGKQRSVDATPNADFFYRANGAFIFLSALLRPFIFLSAFSRLWQNPQVRIPPQFTYFTIINFSFSPDYQ